MSKSVKQRLAAGEPVTVVNVDHVSPSLVEVLGSLPVHAVFIDCEQGAPDFLAVEDMARAARLTGLTSLVRIYQPEPWLVERTLFRKVDGIVVPRIDTADQAQRMIDAVKYCYPDDHSDKVLVIQIESSEALDNLDALLALDGIDAYFIGPVDLSKSLGHGGDYRCPPVQAVMDDTIARIRAGGRNAGVMVDRDNVQRYASLGVTFFYEHVNGFLRYGAELFAAEAERT